MRRATRRVSSCDAVQRDHADENIAPYWSNNEWRSYTFLDAGENGLADLQEDSESIARREAPN